LPRSARRASFQLVFKPIDLLPQSIAFLLLAASLAFTLSPQPHVPCAPQRSSSPIRSPPEALHFDLADV
jgi:hypothetical protein